LLAVSGGPGIGTRIRKSGGPHDDVDDDELTELAGILLGPGELGGLEGFGCGAIVVLGVVDTEGVVTVTLDVVVTFGAGDDGAEVRV